MQTVSQEYHRLSQILPAIKGLGILMVLIYHLWGYSKGFFSFPEIITQTNASSFGSIVNSILYFFCLLGQQGVHLFIIASGFGLTASWWRKYGSEAQQDREFSSGNFWKHRLARIFPLYWLAHALALLLLWIEPRWVPFGTGNISNWGAIKVGVALIASLTTLRNFLFEYYYFLNGAWWYIGLAVQLYLVFPVLIWVGKRWGWSILLAGTLLVTLVYRATIVALPLEEMATDVLIRGAIFVPRVFEFAFGMILAIALLEPRISTVEPCLNWSKNLLLSSRWIWLTGLIWAIGVAFYWTSAEGWMVLRIASDQLIGVGEFCFIFQILSFLPFKKWLNIIGDYSYGIYLTHSNTYIAFWILLAKVPSYWLRFCLVSALSCLFGGLFELGCNWVYKNKIKA
ncbi:acyltransferase family protein [Aerosakkonema funiforme]|uniref:Acyltransferase n=1 Tax=Aerosakkonema funiforme FACHB-1375 TaxID=2949571 RepID=A0A926ZHV9_9CYAN|nr:acyltransferase [Aerosakkonema funiforme]MBD2182602.1 acyltransferase [Aerosakkonema funiforme FACHB-1375]